MPVLGTKLHLPSLRRQLVQRARLTDQLRSDGGEGARLVLVAAPAGSGKTTLLAQWLAADEKSQRRVAWLALDAGDADIRLFLTHLVAAVQTAEPAAGVDAAAVQEAVRFLLDNLPPQVTLAMPLGPTRRSRFPACVRVASSSRYGPRTSSSPPTKRRCSSTR